MSIIKEPDFVPYEGCLGRWVAARQYLGQSKSFGFYGCNFCEKTWMSAHAKKGFKQGCKECDRYFYPLYLWKNDVSNYEKKEKNLEDQGKPHLSHLCEACKKGICSGY